MVRLECRKFGSFLELRSSSSPFSSPSSPNRMSNSRFTMRMRANGHGGGAAGNTKTRRCLPIFFVVGLCCLFFELGAWQMGGIKGDDLGRLVNSISNCTITPHLFDIHHGVAYMDEDDLLAANMARVFQPCHPSLTDYTPCHPPNGTITFPRENMAYLERHCPEDNQKLQCLVPPPKGYVTPFSWPKSRDYVPYVNVPYTKALTVGNGNGVPTLVQLQGNVFKFPAGAMFPQGEDAYIDEIASVVPISDGTVRTALDIGCGVASWGAYLLQRNVIVMSFAPRDTHDVQVQFALDRGVPAVIGVLGTIMLPYPSRSFDMAHCSHCLIPWTSIDGMYMMEVDRVLRPGGYWILSGPPINCKTYNEKEDLRKEQERIEELAELLCWEKVYEKGDIAIWKKKVNAVSCIKRRNNNFVRKCASWRNNSVWYRKMVNCVTPLPKISSLDEVAGGQLKKFPDRLFAVPPRIARGYDQGVTEKSYQYDNELWKKHVLTYKRINKLIGTARYRNIMDMNAGLGGFAAVIDSSNSWVMNVVPTISNNDTLGIIYERGLIGIYHDWCEAFSTYPRTYDFIHASDLFSLYHNRCKIEDILLEMDRILRPEGVIIFRDDGDVLNKVMRISRGMRWNIKMLDHEDGPNVPEKIVVAVKRYWVGAESSSSSS